MSALVGKRLLLGVTGGIAAYKSPEIVRRARERGSQVQVAMTAGGRRFITDLTLQAVSGCPVRTELLDPEAEAGMGHIELARWPDVILVAPASANFLARLAHGFADDLLTTLCLATDRPLVVAPAMNRLMWSNPATAHNLALLRERGATVLGPGSGSQACGETGAGRMLEPGEILDGLEMLWRPESGPLAGRRVLITAGPTREALDPVRYLSNRSSGRMGYAVAGAAAAAGARVTLISGPVAIAPPPGVEHVAVESAQQMHEAVMRRAGGCDVFVASAAVADYRPADPPDRKMKKSGEAVQLRLLPNPDIVSEVAALSGGPFTVGFAAETHNLLDYARDKLERKRLDMIAANSVADGQGFDREDNELQVLWPGGGRLLERAPKQRLAEQLIDLIAERYHAQG
jgi:phosphopantothenoylcysteine decarboxylase/phosphopantothenate--cysteine ligase